MQDRLDGYRDYPEHSQPVEVLTTERDLGQIASQNEVTVAGITEADLELLNATANGVEVRAEDAGREHDIEAAREAATLENEIINAHAQALVENELFDAHAEALKMNEEFERAAAKAVEAEPSSAEAEETSVKPNGKAVDVTGVAAKAEAVSTDDYQSQAEQTLKELGVNVGKLSASSHVEKDYTTGNLIITDELSHNVQIIEPQPDGGKRVVTYDFDEGQGVVTIKADGSNTITAKVGDYVSAENGPDQSAGKDMIELPPAVVKLVGFKRATPLVAEPV